MEFSHNVERASLIMRSWRSILSAGNIAMKQNKTLLICIAVQDAEHRLIAIAEHKKIAINIKPEWLTFMGGDAVLKLIETSLSRLRGCAVEFCTWGFRDCGLLDSLRQDGSSTLRYEDGFIRTSDIRGYQPLGRSIVKDRRHLHYCYGQASDLEKLIAACSLRERPHMFAMVDRSIRLLSTWRKTDPAIAPTRKGRIPFDGDFIVVLGQREQHDSIKLGSPVVKTNAHLASIARNENPTADILYMPHPQVLNKPHLIESHVDTVRPYVDRVLDDPTVSWADIFARCPKVYTITSSLGFEALLHGCSVTTLGGPYYSGWGLTDDRLVFQRRTVRRSVHEVFWCAYLQYTIYCDLERQSVVPFFDDCVSLV